MVRLLVLSKEQFWKFANTAHVLGMNVQTHTPAHASQIGDPLLSLDDLVAFTGTPKSTLYSLRSAGRGPVSLKIGRNLRFRRADVLAWVDALVEDTAA